MPSYCYTSQLTEPNSKVGDSSKGFGRVPSAVGTGKEGYLTAPPVNTMPSLEVPRPTTQPTALGRAVEILTTTNQWLQGYFYVGRKGNQHRLADRGGYDNILVYDNEFRFASG